MRSSLSWQTYSYTLQGCTSTLSITMMGAPTSATVIRGWDRLCSILDDNGHGHWNVFSCCFCFVQFVQGFCDDMKPCLYKATYTCIYRSMGQLWKTDERK